MLVGLEVHVDESREGAKRYTSGMDDGFFDLKTADQLYSKLKADFRSLGDHHKDTYLAYNFFVTANHLGEWLHWSRDQMREHSILRICEHLAVGAKHFSVSNKTIRSVKRASSEGWVENGWVEPGWVEAGKPVVTLTEDEASKFGEETIDVLTLAQKVMTFWSEHL